MCANRQRAGCQRGMLDQSLPQECDRGRCYQVGHPGERRYARDQFERLQRGPKSGTVRRWVFAGPSLCC